MRIEPLKSSVYIAKKKSYLRKHPRKSWWNALNYFMHAYEEMGIAYEVEGEIAENLKKRKFNILEAWQGYPEFHGIVLKIQQILSEYWEFEVIFVPDDDYSVIGQILTGDLIEVAIVEDIEEALGLGENFIDDTWVQGDMLRCVQSIYKHSVKYPLQT